MSELVLTIEDVATFADEAHLRGICDGLELAGHALDETAKRRPADKALLMDVKAAILRTRERIPVETSPEKAGQ